jgi:hypothetical protein
MKPFTFPSGLTWHCRYPRELGYLPQFIQEIDPRSAREQLDESYAHGGGWRRFEGFTLDSGKPPAEWTLEYPEDPPTRIVGYGRLRDEIIALFEHDWVAIVQRDGAYEVARMD